MRRCALCAVVKKNILPLKISCPLPVTLQWSVRPCEAIRRKLPKKYPALCRRLGSDLTASPGMSPGGLI
jgi:hypothetical protein